MTTVLGSSPYKSGLPCTRAVSYFPLLHSGVIAIWMKNAVSAHTTVAMGRGGVVGTSEYITTTTLLWGHGPDPAENMELFHCLPKNSS